MYGPMEKGVYSYNQKKYDLQKHMNMLIFTSDQSHSVFVHSAVNLLFPKFSICMYSTPLFPK